jgi:crotonobetaine/carnitine-CoA ligase
VFEGIAEGALSLEDLQARGADLEPARLDAVAAAVRPQDTATIVYTSGTTGPPKGVIVSHRMLRLSGEAVALVSAARGGDVMFMWEPLYHIGGAQMIVLPLIRGVTLAMVARFSASRFWQQVREAGATQIHFLGGILQILLKQPATPLDRTHGVRIAWGGGCPREVWTEFEGRFGVEIRECYGMTECSSVTTLNAAGVLGSVGRPLPWFEVELIGGDGRPVAVGAQGEIVVRARLPGALTRGYWNDATATARALRDGGAFHTGDLGSWDGDGNFYFHGRMTDNVRVRGQNVSAFEVEHVAAKHPEVEDCAMIGVASDIGEQDIKLFVKPRAGSSLAAEALSRWLEARLAAYQLPRYIVLVEEFERTPSQRIMKHKLAQHAGAAWDRRDAAPSL